MYLSKRKNGYYFIEFVDPVSGRVRRKSTYSKRKQEAIMFLKNFDGEVDPPDDQPQKSLADFAGEYSDFVKKTFSKKYLSSVELSFRKLIESVGNLQLAEITVRDSQRFLTETHQRAKRGAELYYRTLKAAFNRAIEWGYISSNPFLKCRLPRVYKSYPVFLTKKEFNLIPDSTDNQLYRDIFSLGFYSGMRLGEMVNMRWSWVDFEGGFITVLGDQHFISKGKKDRKIPMSAIVREIFERRLANSSNYNSQDYIFMRIPGIKLTEDYVSRKFKKAVKKANLSNKIHFHTLRHSFASNLVQNGVDLYVVKELLGHEDIRTTQVYSHLQTDNLFKAVKLLDTVSKI